MVLLNESNTICAVCKKIMNRGIFKKHYSIEHGLTAEQYYSYKYPAHNTNCLGCGEILKFQNITRGYGKYCSKCLKHCVGVRLGKWSVESGHLSSVSSKAGKIGGKLGGKRAHELHPELFKQIGSRNLKKYNKSLTPEQRKERSRLNGKKTQNLHPELRKNLGKISQTEERKKEISETIKNFHKNNPFFESNRNKDPNDNFGYNRNKDTYYKETRMKSSWEVGFASLCDRNNIKWEYEPKTFDLGYKRYTPDFYLIDKDMWIEIKPKYYQSEEVLNRGNIVGINFLVLDKEDFNNFFNKE